MSFFSRRALARRPGLLALLAAFAPFAAVSAHAAAPASKPAAEPVALRTFAEPGHPAPIAFSIPFAQGSLATPADAFVADDGRAVPQQWRALSRWPDGSVRWAQVVCPPPAPGATRAVALRKNAPRPAAPAPLALTRSAGDSSITVSGGAFTFSIDRATALARLGLAGERPFVFAVSRLVATDDEELPARIDTLEVLESGPLRVTLRAVGFHRSDKRPRGYGRFDVLLTLHAGATHVEIDHSLAVISGDDEENRAQEMQRFRAAGIPVRFASAPELLVESATLAPGQRLFQHEDNAWSVDAHRSGQRAEGLLLATPPAAKNAEAAAPRRPVAFAAVSDFWQQWPKAFTATADGFDIDLFPRLRDHRDRNPYAERENEQIWYYYLRTGDYELRQGVEKSHRLFLGWAPDADAARTASRALLVQPVVFPPLDYFNSTRVATPMLAPFSGGLFDDWDKAFLDSNRSYFDQQAESRWYGLLNWGDWYGERRYNWCNHEYDLPANLFRQAIRFQNPDFFREAVRQTAHRRDVDVVRRHVDAERVGLSYKHSVGHTGGYYKPGENHGMRLPNYNDSDAIFLEGSSTPGHTRVASFFLHHELTGDPRSLETGRAVTDRLFSHPLLTNPKFNYITAREPGWTLVNLLDAWRSTADKRYLDAANRLADNVLAKADGKGVWMRKLKPHQTGGDVTHGELSFTTAFQATGMIELHKTTGRADVRENILAVARYIADNLYRPEFKAFVHSPSRTRAQSPRAGGLAGGNLRYVLAYACVLEPSLLAEFRDPILDSFASTAANRQWVGTKQDPDRPYPHDITSAFYWLDADQTAMNAILGEQLRRERETILARAAPASVFPPATGRWDQTRIGD